MKIIGQSRAILATRELITKVAKTASNVLIFGESGTGKELVARTIHLESARMQHNFVPINCGAIPAELLESELFGFEKGAFTGALSAKAGRFEYANNGSMFLDEIGDMPLVMQVKLLRVLQERIVERIGGVKSIKVDVRIIAATNKNLEELISNDSFREDLYYRLNVFPIKIPSLRERPEDIPLIINYTLDSLIKNMPVCSLSAKALDAFVNYSWPGNVRELCNILERLCIMHPNEPVSFESLPAKMISSFNGDAKEIATSSTNFSEVIINNNNHELNYVSDEFIPDNFDLKEHLVNTELRFIHKALDLSNGIVSHAAQILGIRRTTLVEKMKKLGIDKGSLSA